jgi:endonuclease/exonuclease/phosphatase family metal-dependent hydrolase
MRSKKQVVRTNKKRTNKRRFIQKRLSGGNPNFTVMTFNVECWLNQMNRNFLKNFLENDDTDIISNWKKMKDIFKDVDIACIQENALIKQKDGSFKNFIDNIGDLKLISSCQSHDFHWPQTQGLYDVGSKISNSIYSKYTKTLSVSTATASATASSTASASATAAPLESQLTEDGKTTIDTSGKPHPRCWAISEIPIHGKPVKVASIHLSGGRFDDIAALTGNNFLVKTHQIRKLLEEKPDIVCGDLNTKLVRPEEDTYLIELLKSENKKSTEAIAKKWRIWMYGLDEIFKEFGYVSVFKDGEAPETSIFGGTVDMIYYNPLLLTCSKSYAVDGVMKPGKRILSDHAPIKAEFSFTK